MPAPSLAPLRLPGYRRLLGAYSVNNLGDWLGEIALSLLILHATGSVLAVTALWVLGRFVPGLLAPLAVAALERDRLAAAAARRARRRGGAVRGCSPWPPPAERPSP